LSHDEHSYCEISNTIHKKHTLNKRCTRPKPEDPSLLSNDFVISEKSIESSTRFNENQENTLNSTTSVKPKAVIPEGPHWGSKDSNTAFNQLLQRLEYISKQMDGINREIEAIERRQI
jgi:negative regulator of replication initiation